MELRLFEALINQALPAFATLVGAFIGAWSAFRLTDAAHARQRDDERAAAANRALFTLLRQYNTLKNIRDQLIEPVRADPGRFINMNALMPLEHTTVRPDFDSLTFILETPSRALLVDLMLENERFHSAVAAINERSHLHMQVVQPVLIEAGVREGGQYPLEAVEAALGPRLGPHLKRSTEDLISHVDSFCRSAVPFAKHFAAEMKKLFPKKTFITFDEKTAPNQ